MRRLLATIAIVFVFTILAVGQASNGDPELDTAHRLWATYFSHPCPGPASLIDAVIARDFTFIGVHGEVVSRHEFMKGVGCTSSQVSSTDDVQMRIFDDTAIVIGRLTIKPVGDVSPNDPRVFRYTNIYRKSPKRWELVHSQFTRIVDN